MFRNNGLSARAVVHLERSPKLHNVGSLRSVGKKCQRAIYGRGLLPMSRRNHRCQKSKVHVGHLLHYRNPYSPYLLQNGLGLSSPFPEPSPLCVEDWPIIIYIVRRSTYVLIYDKRVLNNYYSFASSCPRCSTMHSLSALRK